MIISDFSQLVAQSSVLQLRTKTFHAKKHKVQRRKGKMKNENEQRIISDFLIS